MRLHADTAPYRLDNRLPVFYGTPLCARYRRDHRDTFPISRDDKQVTCQICQKLITLFKERHIGRYDYL